MRPANLLLDKIKMLFILEYLVELDNVWVVEFLQYGYFVLEPFKMLLVQTTFLNDFYRSFSSCLFINAEPNLAIAAYMCEKLSDSLPAPSTLLTL